MCFEGDDQTGRQLFSGKKSASRDKIMATGLWEIVVLVAKVY